MLFGHLMEAATTVDFSSRSPRKTAVEVPEVFIRYSGCLEEEAWIVESKNDGDDKVKERRGSCSGIGGVLFSVRRRKPPLARGYTEVLLEDKERADFGSFGVLLKFTRWRRAMFASSNARKNRKQRCNAQDGSLKDNADAEVMPNDVMRAQRNCNAHQSTVNSTRPK